MDLDKDALDRHITGNYGEDQLRGHTVCPECGSDDVSDKQERQRSYFGTENQPPFELICEDCKHEWTEDS